MIDLEPVLKQAVQPAVDAILRLEARVAKPCRWVLAEIRGHLTEPEYTVAKLRRDLGVTNNWLMSRFEKSVGLTPWRFIREIRLETAARLFRDTRLTVGQVVILVGYVDPSSFTRLFRDWCGLNPLPFRERVRAARVRAGDMPNGVLSWTYWRRCMRYELTAAEVRELVAYLVRLYDLALPTGIFTTRLSSSDRIAHSRRIRRPYSGATSKPAPADSTESTAAPEPKRPNEVERR